MGARLGLCLLCVLVLSVPAGHVAAVGPGPDGDPRAAAPLTTPEDFENTLFRITVFENGSARWTIQHARPLVNETEIDRFEAFAAEFNSRETATVRAFRNRTRQLLAFGRNVTDRNMTARAFDHHASVSELGQTRGVVELSYVWTEFARTNDSSVRVGDVFEGGMYIAAGQRLEFRRGPDLRFADVRPSPDSMADEDSLDASESVTWTGERQFADQRPAAVLVPRNSTTPGGGSDSGGADGGDDPEPVANGTLPVALGSLFVVLAVVGGLAWYRVRESTAGESSEAAGASGPPAAGSGGEYGNAAVADEELLSDEDRVLQLLHANGGRMKQVDIVEETDWSKSKVSMLLSDMEEADQISKLRLGRENIISVAGEEPDAAGSPFEDLG